MQVPHAPLLSASVIPPGELQVVQIYFDTSTFDEIERDVKVSETYSCKIRINKIIIFQILEQTTHYLPNGR